MSTPITNCLVIRAAKGDERAFEVLTDRTWEHLLTGAGSRWPCACNPPCSSPTDEQLQILHTKFGEEVLRRLQATDSRQLRGTLLELKLLYEEHLRRQRFPEVTIYPGGVFSIRKKIPPDIDTDIPF